MANGETTLMAETELDHAVECVLDALRPRRRPWEPTEAEIERDGPFADHAAWQRWMAETTEREAPNGAFLDVSCMDYEEAIGLYVVMCKLADGEFPAPTEARA